MAWAGPSIFPIGVTRYDPGQAYNCLGPNHWAESGGARFTPGNILISSHNANFIAIISRKTGKIVWRVGPNFVVWEYMSPFVGNGTGAGPSMRVRWVYRIRAVPYDWVPKGVAHSEVPVHAPKPANFHIAAGKD